LHNEAYTAKIILHKACTTLISLYCDEYTRILGQSDCCSAATPQR